MNSAALTALGFGAWYPMNASTEKSLLATIPARTGVYAIRCSNANRAIGPSDLVYFGKAANLTGLKRRIRQYFHPGYDNATSLRIKALITACTDFELSWIEYPVDEVKQLEGQLIAQFERAYGILPPWNRCR